MVALDLDSGLLQRNHDLVADVHQLIAGRTWQISLLGSQFVTKIRSLVTITIPWSLDAVQSIRAVRSRLFKSHVVQNEELTLGSKKRLISNSSPLKIGHRLIGNASRIEWIFDQCHGVQNLADNIQCRNVGKRIHEGSLSQRDINMSLS